MNYSTIDKLARVRDPAAAVASAAAGVGIPVGIVKLAFPARMVGRAGRLLRPRREMTRIVGSRDILGRGGSTAMNRAPMSGTAPSRMPRAPRDSGELDVAALRGEAYPPLSMSAVRAPGVPPAGGAKTTMGPSPAGSAPTTVSPVPAGIAQTMGQNPGLGQRALKNWWTLPVGGAGLYGLHHMASGFSGGDVPQAGYPQQMGLTPEEERYQQMMALARQYGY